MSTVASIVSLKAKSKRASDHAFNTAGILEILNPTLASIGAATTVFDVRASLYPT